jgi:hypothetical protein
MEREKDQSGVSSRRDGHTTFVPLLLIVISLLMMTLFQVVQLTREHDQLNARLEAQIGPLKESQSVRDQLQSVATKTVGLASNGNENAARIVDHLEKAGIKINPTSN